MVQEYTVGDGGLNGNKYVEVIVGKCLEDFLMRVLGRCEI